MTGHLKDGLLIGAAGIVTGASTVTLTETVVEGLPAILTAIGTLVTAAGVFYTAWAAALREKRQADQLREVRAATDEKLGSIAEVVGKASVEVGKVHTLVNNQTGLNLLAIAELSRWKAVASKSPADEKRADQAEADYAAHQKQQAKVDAKEKE